MPAAVTLIRPLVFEPPYASGVALKKKKKFVECISSSFANRKYSSAIKYINLTISKCSNTKQDKKSYRSLAKSIILKDRAS